MTAGIGYSDPTDGLDGIENGWMDGIQGHNVPWLTLDVAELVARLPDIHEGASKWIRAFEDETMGKLLAMGDIKAVWTQCLGASTMEDILRHSKNDCMMSH